MKAKSEYTEIELIEKTIEVSNISMDYFSQRFKEDFFLLICKN